MSQSPQSCWDCSVSICWGCYRYRHGSSASRYLRTQVPDRATETGYHGRSVLVDRWTMIRVVRYSCPVGKQCAGCGTVFVVGSDGNDPTTPSLTHPPQCSTMPPLFAGKYRLTERNTHTPPKSLRPHHFLSAASIERTDGIDRPHPSRSSYLHTHHKVGSQSTLPRKLPGEADCPLPPKGQGKGSASKHRCGPTCLSATTQLGIHSSASAVGGIGSGCHWQWDVAHWSICACQLEFGGLCNLCRQAGSAHFASRIPILHVDLVSGVDGNGKGAS